MRPAFAVGLVFAGCCSNVIFLELLARDCVKCFPGTCSSVQQ
uniref:Solute carrier family 35, member B4 n=1 Tax=Mus musculus TaxID=10090 RepID=S4R2P0_MOUSE